MPPLRKHKRGPKLDRWVSLYRAACLLGEARITVQKRALMGEVDYDIVNGDVVIARASVDRILSERPPSRTSASV